MAAYAADKYRESVQSSVYSTDSTYIPFSNILRNYPSVPDASSSNANPSGYRFPPTQTGQTPGSRYDTAFPGPPHAPPREGGDSNYHTPSSHSQFQPDSTGSGRHYLNDRRHLHDAEDAYDGYDGSAGAHYYAGPATSVVPPTPTQEATFEARVNPQHLSAISAVSSYSQGAWSEGNVRETWRSSSTSAAADPFSFRHFETPQVDPPRVVISSTQASQDNYTYTPTNSFSPATAAGRAPSKVHLQHNFSRPIRKEPQGLPIEQPPRKEFDNNGIGMYSALPENYRNMAMPRNLPKTTPNPMYGDENFLQSSPSGSPHASPQISASGSHMIGSFSSPARSPSPISLNSESARDLFYQRQYQQPQGQQYSRFDSPSNGETQMQAIRSDVTRYSENGTVHPPAPKQFIPIPSSPPPMRPGSSVSLYSRYSFYSAGDLPSGASTPQPGAHFDNFPRTEDSSSTRTPTPTRAEEQQEQHLTASNSNPNGGTQSRNAHPRTEQPTENLDNPQTPHEFLALGILHHEANRLQESAYCFERAATEHGGCGVGMLMWGLSLRHGWGTQKDERAAFGWLRKAADAAVTDLEGAKEKGERNAVKSELVLAIYEVGQCFFHGWGVETDKRMAVSYFKVAARLGDVDAQQELGFCYANGKGCKKDLKEAAKWYRAAAAQGASTVGLAWIYKPKYGGDEGSPKAKDRSNLLSPHSHTTSSIYSTTRPGSMKEGPRKLKKPNPKLKSNPSSPRPSCVADVLEVRNLNQVLQEEGWDPEREAAW